jgi:hypothetical protein
MEAEWRNMSSRSNEPIGGVTRLVNPPEDNREVIAPEENEVERVYWGRILHVADRALRQGQDGESKHR